MKENRGEQEMIRVDALNCKLTTILHTPHSAFRTTKDSFKRFHYVFVQFFFVFD